MSNSFFQAFSVSLEAAEKVMGESWRIEAVEYAAIAIDALTATDRAALGGRFADVVMTLHVSAAEVARSGVKKGTVLMARETKVRVKEIQDDGDGARTLLCTGPGVEAPR